LVISNKRLWFQPLSKRPEGSEYVYSIFMVHSFFLLGES
jgi:hypothetical protein